MKFGKSKPMATYSPVPMPFLMNRLMIDKLFLTIKINYMQEKKLSCMSGIPMVILQILLAGLIGYLMYSNWDKVGEVSTYILPVGLLIVICIMFGGYVVVQPNEAAIASFMGTYKGSLKENGFWFCNPFYGCYSESLKIENFQTPELTVNEKGGSPIQIAAIISYKISDIYKAHYAVENAELYVKNQFEISLRTHAKNHTYNELSSDDHEFVQDLTEKVEKAGVEILDAKITHLNYAPEIASAMLQKQQASAMSEAKQIIVDNAVSIAKHAVDSINGEMLPEQKSKFISDLIIVLCSEKGVSPVLSV